MASSSSVALALELVRVLEDKKAEDVVVLDVSEQHTLIDCFVIATARGGKHAQVVGWEALAYVKEQGLKPWHLETSDEWVCGDFGDVVVHVFTPQTREYYDLEALWADAKTIHRSPAPAA